MSSLGWRTQSTVLPSKAKEIKNVSARSMFDLKAALYAKEEETRRGERRSGRKRKRRSGGGLGDEVALQGENRGTADRAAREEAEVQSRLSGAALAEKSKLYDELREKALNVKDGAGDDRYMVNFAPKGHDAENGDHFGHASMHEGVKDMEKRRLEWESETLRQLEMDRASEDASMALGNEALAATEETERQRESKRNLRNQLEATRLKRLQNIMTESSSRKFLNLGELGGLSQADSALLSRAFGS